MRDEERYVKSLRVERAKVRQDFNEERRARYREKYPEEGREERKRAWFARQGMLEDSPQDPMAEGPWVAAY